MKTALIIGGGLGGLFTGAILAKEGLQVTVVEKNAIIGGGLQSFERGGELFDTGMHVIGGMQPGGNIRHICEYLGIMDEIRIRNVDDDCTDQLYFSEDHTWYRLAKGKRGFIDSLSAYFPHERQALENYVKAIYAITEEMSLFYLRPSDTDFPAHSADFLMPADGFIAKYVGDRKLRSVLAYMNPLYGGRAGQTPAFIHASINVLYINGTSRFVDGSIHFADTLARFITQHGGRIVKGDAVEWVEVANRHVEHVRTKKGLQLSADYYISDIHPCTLMKLMDEHALPKSYRTRLDSIPNSYSAFSLYIKMKEKSFPYINHSEYYMNRYDEIWHFGRMDKPWPMGFLFMTPPEANQGAYSRKVLITAPMSFEAVRRWENTQVGHRGADYEAWKAERTKMLLELVEEMHPGFCGKIEQIYSSSPLSIRDFYGAKEGGISGFSKDCNNIVLSQVPVKTKIDNLLLTGQNNNLHGFCGVPLTAINTCEAIFGRNYLLNKLKPCQEPC